MGIFLFLKQIVDVIYQIKALDVAMVLFAVVLIAIKLIKNQNYKTIIKDLCPLDYVVVLLAVIYIFAFIKNTGSVNDFVKIESAFVIYFLARLYATEIMDNGHKLAIASYMVLYSNFIYAIAHQLYIKKTERFFPWEEFKYENCGGLYYYKTDLALGMIIAMIFVYTFGKNVILKWITILAIPELVLAGTKARMGMVVMALVLVIILARQLILRLKKNVNDNPGKQSSLIKNLLRVVGVLIVIFFIGLQFSPVKKTDWYGTGVSEELDNKIENICHSRHVIYWDTLHYISNERIDKQFFGNDIGTLPLHNQRGMMSHSMYLNLLYATGYIGFFLLCYIVYRTCLNVQDYKNRTMIEDQDSINTKNRSVQNSKYKQASFITLVMLMCFLIFGLSMDTFVYTQISWFPLMFVGVSQTLANRK